MIASPLPFFKQLKKCLTKSATIQEKGSWKEKTVKLGEECVDNCQLGQLLYYLAGVQLRQVQLHMLNRGRPSELPQPHSTLLRFSFLMKVLYESSARVHGYTNSNRANTMSVPNDTDSCTVIQL